MAHLFSSLRFRIIIIIFLASLPLLGWFVYLFLEERRHYAYYAKEDLLRVAQQASMYQEHLIHEGHQLLMALAHCPALRRKEAALSSAYFAQLLQKQPCFAQLAAADAVGNIFASAIPFSGTFNFADLPFFQRALETRDFAVGDLRIGPIIGTATLHLGYPVLNDTGQVQ